ncbi:MAG: tetratricopeptide repeat protein, partial [Candidatus Omnitrophica bacterium]|nr:tetratricopeptide repeat protein [Candidatus Omnitrophota bacterium]
ALRDKLETARADVRMFKESIRQIRNGAGTMSEEAVSEEERIKVLQDSLGRAEAEDKEAQTALRDAGTKVAKAEDALRKLAANVPKDAGAKPKAEELSALEMNLERAQSGEVAARDRAKEAEDKVKSLEVEIGDAQANVKKAQVAKTTADKNKIKTLEENIKGAVAEEEAARQDLQHLAKKIDSAWKEREVLLSDIKADEKEIADLKRIIEKEVVEISSAQSGSKASAKGLSEEAKAALTILNDEINVLKAKNKKLDSELQQSRRSEVEARRKAEKEKMLPEEMSRKISKERLDMHYNLAVVYDQSGRYQDAKREYLKCLKIDPKDAGVHYNLGILYDDKLNDNRKAEYHYRQFLRLRPMGQDSMQVRGWLTNIELETRLGKEMR